MKVPKLIKFLLLLLSFYFYLFPFLSAAQETKNIEVTVSVPPDESDIHVDIENNITTEEVKKLVTQNLRGEIIKCSNTNFLK